MVQGIKVETGRRVFEFPALWHSTQDESRSLSIGFQSNGAALTAGLGAAKLNISSEDRDEPHEIFRHSHCLYLMVRPGSSSAILAWLCGPLHVP